MYAWIIGLLIISIAINIAGIGVYIYLHGQFVEAARQHISAVWGTTEHGLRVLINEVLGRK